MRAAVVFVLLASALAGCVGQGDRPVAAELDAAAPHCVGECVRIVDDSPAHPWGSFLAVDPKDPEHIVIAAYKGSDDFGPSFRKGRVSVSEDGGATWDTRTVPGGADAGPTHPLARYTLIGQDPVLVFLPDGTLVMSAIAANRAAVPDVPVQGWPGYAIYTTRSTDGGHTWGDARVLDPGEGIVAFDRITGAGVATPWRGNIQGGLALGPDGTLLLVWTQITYAHPTSQEQGGQVVFSSSEDGGLTWSPIRVVDEDRGAGASPVIGRDGSWRVAYRDLTSNDLRLAESNDRGQTWDARAIGETSWIPVLRAQTLASGVERLLLIYTTGGDENWGLHQTELTWSDDDGDTWALPLVIDTPQGEGAPMPDVVGATGDSVWVTYFDIEGAYAEQHSRYLAVKVVDGVAGEPLVLDEMDMAAANLGYSMGLGVKPDGDALATWVTYMDGEYDLVWARITAGAAYKPMAVAEVRAQPVMPTGLGEPVAYEFTGHVNVPYYCFDPDPTLEQAVRDQASATFEFEVPPNTRFINGTLQWETTGPTPSTSDLDLILYDSAGDAWDAASLDVPEVFQFELQVGDEGAWTAVVYNCENPPTDFTLNMELF